MQVVLDAAVGGVGDEDVAAAVPRDAVGKEQSRGDFGVRGAAADLHHLQRVLLSDE